VLATASWEALGTTALVRVDHRDALDRARAIVEAELRRIDAAASNFRADSELERLNRAAGRFTPISALLHEAIAVALRAASVTHGAVDPTLAGRWRDVELSGEPRGARVPSGLTLDLGATGKALAADRAARAVAAHTGAGVLVALGGDIATAGPVPAGGWAIHVTDDHRSRTDAPGQTVAIDGGGLATSSITTRRSLRGGRTTTHIVDPATGDSPTGPWRTASVVAGSCVDANIASTAAIVFGDDAIARLSEWSLAARFVAHDGEAFTIGGWPAEDAS
jgi:thiamine biosynthesis lipoprotein